MGFIFKGILAVIWLLVVPCLAGGFYFRREKRTCGEYLLAGYTLLFAITELLSLTMIFTKQPLHVLTITYGVVAGVLAFLGARSLYKKRQKETGEGAGTYCGRRDWNFPGACGGRNSDSVPACRCGALCPYG